MLKKQFFYTLPITFLLVSNLAGYSQTYYVSNTGSDSYTKTQAENTATPWKTIQHACNNATPGTTIEIMAGTYYEQDTITVSGTAAGGYITLTNYNGGAVVINGNAKAVQLLTISSKNYIKINGLQFYNCIGNNTSIGLFIDGVSNHIEISNNTIHHIYWNTSWTAVPNSNDNVNPLIAWGDSVKSLKNLIIEGNTFYDCAPGFSEVCSVNGNVDTFNIINNLVYDNQNIGIDIEGNEGVGPVPATDHARHGLVKGNTVYKCHSIYDAAAGGIYTDGGEYITIEQNTSYRNDFGIEVGCETAGDTTLSITVRDNLIYRNGLGMQVGGYNGPVKTGSVINSEITNNTFYDNDTAQAGNGELSLSYTKDCSFYNNIFYSLGNTIMSSGWSGNSVGLALDYNRYYSINGDSANASFSYGTASYTGFSKYKSGSGYDAHSNFSNPSLTDISLTALDFHLLAASTCINEGMPSFPVDTSERDFYGEIRIVGSHIDIGADEYQRITTGLKDLALTSISVYPNPGNGVFTIDGVPVGSAIEVYNSLGMLVKTIKETTATSIHISIADLANSIYLLRIKSQDGTTISQNKVIKVQ